MAAFFTNWKQKFASELKINLHIDNPMFQRLLRLYLRLAEYLNIFHCAGPAEKIAEKHLKNSSDGQHAWEKSFANFTEGFGPPLQGNL